MILDINCPIVLDINYTMVLDNSKKSKKSSCIIKVIIITISIYNNAFIKNRSPSPTDSTHIIQLAQDSVKMIESADTMTSANQSIKSADQNKKSSGHRRPSKREKHRKHHHTRYLLSKICEYICFCTLSKYFLFHIFLKD